MRTSAVALLLLLAFPLVGCSKKDTTAPPVTQSISGVVRVGQAPLANAAVGLSGSASALTSTAANGSYQFSGLSSGSYLVHVMHSDYSMSPSGFWVDVPGGSSNIDFHLTPTATRFSLTGTVSGTTGVRMMLSGDNAGNALTPTGGTWSIPNLIVGDYTLIPSKTGYHFSPPSITVTGQVLFTHPETGNGTLGSVTITSITHGAQDATAFFEITSPPVDGTGTIRARRRSEIGAGLLTAYNAMWDAGGTVVVSLNSTGFGVQTIEITLGPNPTIIAASSSFIVSQSLTPLNGNDFTALPH